MSQHRIHDLVEAYLENRLSDGDRAELQQALVTSREACRLFWEGVQQHALIGELLAEAHGFDMGQRELKTGTWPRTGVRRMATTLALLAAAAALLVAVWTFYRPAVGPAPTPAVDLGPVIAQLEETEGDVYIVSDAGRVRGEVGQALFAGHEIQTRGEGGSAVVKYPDATRLEMGADSTLRLLPGASETPAKKVFLTEGVVVADVSSQPAGRPLVLSTPFAEVRGPGARFLAAATPSGTRVELETGKVQLAPANAGPPVDLEPGSYAVAAMGGVAPAARPLPLRLTEEKTVLQVGKSLQAAVFSDDGSLFASAAGDGLVKVWDASGRRMRSFLPLPTPSASALAFSLDGKLLAAACPDKTTKIVRVMLWDLASGAERAGFQGPQEVSALAFSPDGRRLAGGGADGKRQPDFKLWDLISGQEEALPPQAIPQGGKWRGVASLAFSPDGSLLALGGRDGVVRLVDLAGGKETIVLHGHTAAINCLAFAPDGATLATGAGAKDRTVRLWDLPTARERSSLSSSSGAVFSVCFSPDGATLAAGCDGGVGRLWDTASGMEKATVKGHKSLVRRVAFSADGRTLAAAGRDGVVKFWEVNGSEEELE